MLRYEDARDDVEVTAPGGKPLVVDLEPLVGTFRAIGPSPAIPGATDLRSIGEGRDGALIA